jgi:exosome complex component CSL4
MSKKIRQRDRKVLPGEELGVIEEFVEGEGVYQDEGILRSEELGRAQFKIREHLVNIEKITPKVVIPEEGDNVIAEVGSVARNDARVDIFMVNGKMIHPSFGGVIHISDISKSYVKNIDRAMRSGDIIKAKVVNTKNRLNQLSMEGGEFGVIYAYCSRCGTLLEANKGRLNCPNCGRNERRQTAEGYGKEELL